MNYIEHLLILIAIYVNLAVSLNLLVGYAGLLSLNHAAFYGIGAYLSTLLMVEASLPYALSFLLAILGTTCLSFVISLPSLRLRRDYFVLASLGFQIIVFTILYNWKGLTRGSYGIAAIPRPSVFGYSASSIEAYFVFSILSSLICLGLLFLLLKSPFGRALKAIRDDETAAASLGKNVTRFKITAFAVAAAFASVSGILFAGHIQYISPTSFTLMESVFILSIIIIGGTGNIGGPVAGTFLLISLPEALRLLSIPDSIAPNVREILYGLLIILTIRFRPQGLFGEYRLE